MKTPFLVWLTGLSGAGKSSISKALQDQFKNQGIPSIILDGDDLRLNLNADLTFSDKDRIEGARRAAERAKTIIDNGSMAIVALISPFEVQRENAKKIVGEERYVEIYVSTPLAVCEARDPKGLYKKAREGAIKDMTGIDSRFEVPIHPHIVVDASQESVAEIVNRISLFLFPPKH
jgi:adenylyl-sulfate kinase